VVPAFDCLHGLSIVPLFSGTPTYCGESMAKVKNTPRPQKETRKPLRSSGTLHAHPRCCVLCGQALCSPSGIHESQFSLCIETPA
jgi:hypothetical protein